MEYHLKVVGVGSAMAFVGLATLVIRGAKGVSAQIGKIPKPVLWIGVALLVIALLHPVSRKKIVEILDQLLLGSVAMLEAGFAGLYPLLEAHNQAQATAIAGLTQAKSVLVTSAS